MHYYYHHHHHHHHYPWSRNVSWFWLRAAEREMSAALSSQRDLTFFIRPYNVMKATSLQRTRANSLQCGCVLGCRCDRVPADCLVHSARIQRHHQSRMVALNYSRREALLYGVRSRFIANNRRTADVAAVHQDKLRLNSLGSYVLRLRRYYICSYKQDPNGAFNSRVPRYNGAKTRFRALPDIGVARRWHQSTCRV